MTLTTLTPNGLVPVGELFVSTACTRCDHHATGIVTKHSQATEIIAKWDDPPEDCFCVCHEAWRIVNNKRATTGGAT